MREFSTTELAKLLGISRQAVLKKIHSGELRARRVGRSFVINEKDLPSKVSKNLSPLEEELLDRAVDKTIKDYEETLRLLGKE
ncbi:MAG: helix-turn-helix domain-containing protein [bacterium]|nr:helix-turn-helix domain-containing protein [bacterium]